MEFGPDGLSPLPMQVFPWLKSNKSYAPVVAVSFEGRLITDLVVNSPLVAAIAQRLPGELRSMI